MATKQTGTIRTGKSSPGETQNVIKPIQTVWGRDVCEGIGGYS